MVGGGIYDAEKSVRPQSTLFDKRINFNFNAVVKVIPEQNKIITDDNREWTYDHLIIASGNRVDFGGIKGIDLHSFIILFLKAIIKFLYFYLISTHFRRTRF